MTDGVLLRETLRESDLGRAVQVDPIKPMLKPPGSTLLKLTYDGPLSNLAFKFNLRHHTSTPTAASSWTRRTSGRGSHSSTSQLNTKALLRINLPNTFCLMRVSRLAQLYRSIEKTRFPVIPWFTPLITAKYTFVDYRRPLFSLT